MTRHNFYNRGCVNYEHKKFLSEISFGRTCIQCIRLGAPFHASIPTLSFFTGRMSFLLPNQQRQSTEGKNKYKNNSLSIMLTASNEKQQQL